jgi:hypothetical protein
MMYLAMEGAFYFVHIDVASRNAIIIGVLS